LLASCAVICPPFFQTSFEFFYLIKSIFLSPSACLERLKGVSRVKVPQLCPGGPPRGSTRFLRTILRAYEPALLLLHALSPEPFFVFKVFLVLHVPSKNPRCMCATHVAFSLGVFDLKIPPSRPGRICFLASPHFLETDLNIQCLPFHPFSVL